MSAAMTAVDVAVAVLAWIGGLSVLCTLGFVPIILLGWWHDRHPRPPGTTSMPARYKQVLDERDIRLWEQQAVAEAETIVREAAP